MARHECDERREMEIERTWAKSPSARGGQWTYQQERSDYRLSTSSTVGRTPRNRCYKINDNHRNGARDTHIIQLPHDDLIGTRVRRDASKMTSSAAADAFQACAARGRGKTNGTSKVDRN